MCRTYNTIGSLMTIQEKLNRHNINEFESVYDLIDFKDKYPALQQKIVLEHTRRIEQERTSLEQELVQLDETASKRRLELSQTLQQTLADLDRRSSQVARWRSSF